jgi:hypothetical protein
LIEDVTRGENSGRDLALNALAQRGTFAPAQKFPAELITTKLGEFL